MKKQSKNQMNMEGASEIISDATKRLKGNFNSKQVLIVAVCKDKRTGRFVTLFGNGDEEIELQDFSLQLFELVGRLYTNISVREARNAIKKDK